MKKSYGFHLLQLFFGFDGINCFLRSTRLYVTNRLYQENSSLSLSPRTFNSIFICPLLIAANVASYSWAVENKINTFSSSEGQFSFVYSDDLIISPKPVKTHQIEVYLKSKTVPGFSVGLTVL